MSINSTTSSIHCKKALKSSLSQTDKYPYSRHSLKECQNRTLSKDRKMSTSEESSGDLLADLSSLPFKQINTKCNRRVIDFKSPLIQQNQGFHSERRNSMPQISLSSLLPNPFRSKKHHHKNMSKDDTHTPANTFNNNYSLHHNDMMTMKTEQPVPLKSFNTIPSNSRTTLSISNDRLSSPVHEDSTSSISSLSSLFTLQSNPSVACSAETLPLELHTSLCIAEIYREHFYEYFHINYCGEFEHDGSFLASLRYFYNKPIVVDNNNTSSSIDNTTTQSQARAIIRTSTRNYDVSVMLDGTNEDNILQLLFNKADLPSIHTYKPIGDPKANEKIYLFDKTNDERQNCKIGIIYQGAEQINEYEIFSNDGLSDEMSCFLNSLADIVRLKGFHKYRGDLDIKDDLHGDESYYTKYKNHEIMFNVAPKIPSTKANGQCIERKSLVGNAFICIVFQESDAEFIPDYISGKVTQIYITVKPHTIDEDLYYKIGIWHRNDFTSTVEPSGGIYKYDESFRDYFLTLLLNSLTAATESPSLRFRVAEQRQRLRQEEFKRLLQNLSIGQILDTTSEAENTNSHLLQRVNSRSGSIISIATQSTTESIGSSSGRISPVSTKKRRISKIFGVFTSRSGSISSAPSTSSLSVNLTNNNQSTASSTQHETSMMQRRTSNKENDKRRSSVKYYHAPPPPPPILSQLNSLPVQFTASNEPPTPPHRSSQSFDALNENSSKQNHVSNPGIAEEKMRSRSNSSPDVAPIITKISPSNVAEIKEEIDNTSSLLDYENELIEEEKIQHRRTLTEPPLTLPINTNS
ncbi:unnamed protein product [Rotaria magnacalcarata]|uniref:Rap-GAP domain-containing protein n=1 Tax=Rotaria magnacalcarata TaxID=392030 RepID=A0A816MP12_9BILA|nr:unnamed protein product [Rotaria magnacalcarata]